MPRRPLAVVQFGQFGDGDLPARYDDTAGWGTNPVRMDAHIGNWVAMETDDSQVHGFAGRIASGLLVPRRIAYNAGPPAISAAAIYRFAGTPVPEAGRLFAQIGKVAGVERPPASFAFAGVAVGLQTLDGTRGTMAVWLDTSEGFLLYQWAPTGYAFTASVDRPDPEAGIIGLRWADGRIIHTVGDQQVSTEPLTGDTIATEPMPDDASNLEPFVLHFGFGIVADWFGIAWAALTETADDRAPWTPAADTNNGTGWALTAATRDRRTRGDIPASTWSWKWRLNDSSEVTWSQQQPAGPKVAPHATHAQVRYNGRLLHAGPVGPINRNATEDGAVTGSWTAGDRVAQLGSRVLYPTSTLAWVDQPLGTVLRDLVGDCNELPGGDTGVRVDPDLVGPTITLTAKARDTVRATIAAAVDLARGEWWIDRDDTLRWSETGRGGQRPFLADHGGTVSEITEATVPATHGTALWVTGDATAVYRQATDIATSAVGRLDLVTSDPDQTQPATLAARADRMLDDAVAMRPAWTATLRPGAWEPSKLAPGDTARLVSAALGVDEWLRVYEITVTGTGDDATAPKVEITFGAPRPDFVRLLATDRRRVATLERR